MLNAKQTRLSKVNLDKAFDDLENKFDKRFNRLITFIQFSIFILLPGLVGVIGFNIYSVQESDKLIKQSIQKSEDLMKQHESALKNFHNTSQDQLTSLKNESTTELTKIKAEGARSLQAQEDMLKLKQEYMELFKKSQEILSVEIKKIDSKFQEVEKRYSELDSQMKKNYAVVQGLNNYGAKLDTLDEFYGDKLSSLRKQLSLQSKLINQINKDLKYLEALYSKSK